MPLAYRDTVASVGVLVGRTLPFVAANDTIRWFRQALALDEVRVEVWSLADLLGHNGPSFISWPSGRAYAINYFLGG